jgi:threonine synthase
MSNKGIWEYANQLKPLVKESFRLSLSEGNTPLEKHPNLAKDLGLENIFLKREDLNPTGAQKDRGLAFEISAHLQDEANEFAIASSGNSAISAINLLKGTQYHLHIFLSSNLSDSKIKRLVKPLEGIAPRIFKCEDVTFENFKFYFSPKPLSTAFYFSRTKNLVLLRGSTDIYGFEGFKTIAFELKKEVQNSDSIFIPTSSGTTAKGIYEGFKAENWILPFHLVQTTKINTLVHKFDKDFEPQKCSLADSIVDRIGHRALEVQEIITKSEGTGWIISDAEIRQAQNILQKHNILTSNESALIIVAVQKARSKNWDIKNPICLFTGTI